MRSVAWTGAPLIWQICWNSRCILTGDCLPVSILCAKKKTSYETRFGQPFNGLIVPFGSLVEYYPGTAKDQSRIHQFGKKVSPGLFPKGDVLVADLEELETMDASEIHSKRLNAKEVIFPKEGEFIFPIADGRI